MGNMRVREEVTVVANRRKFTVIGRRVDRAELAKNVPVASPQSGPPAAIFKVLGLHAHAGIRKNFALPAQLGKTFDRRVVMHLGARTQRHLAANVSIRSNHRPGTENRAILDDGRRMNARFTVRFSCLILLHQVKASPPHARVPREMPAQLASPVSTTVNNSSAEETALSLTLQTASALASFAPRVLRIFTYITN